VSKRRPTRKAASRHAGRRLRISVLAAIALLTAGGIAAVFAVANLTAGGGSDGAAVQEVGVTGHDVSPTSGGADIHFANTGVDFGVVPLNKEVGYEFSYANVGNETLRIEDVRVRVLEGC
jgi:hypothetical protein